MSKKTETTVAAVKMPVYGNVVKQDDSLAQVTQLKNPSAIRADKDGTLRITEVKKSK